MTPEERLLSDEMVSYWGAFVKQGVPNAPQLAAWPPYTAKSESVMSLGTGGSKLILDFAAEHHCAFWDHILFQ